METTKKSPLAAIAVVSIIISVIAIVLAIVLPIILKPKSSSSSSSESPASLCTDLVPIYIFLVTAGGFAVASKETTMSGATIQNDGEPVLSLCASSGPHRIPLYSYTSVWDDANNQWGTSPFPPPGMMTANEGEPLGYMYDVDSVDGISVLPIYMNQVIGDNGEQRTFIGIVTHEEEPTYGIHSYPRVSTVPLGYSL